MMMVMMVGTILIAVILTWSRSPGFAWRSPSASLGKPPQWWPWETNDDYGMYDFMVLSCNDIVEV